jgi:hypothetical protein
MIVVTAPSQAVYLWKSYTAGREAESATACSEAMQLQSRQKITPLTRLNLRSHALCRTGVANLRPLGEWSV